MRLADGVTAVFRVTGVRQYRKSRFPAETIYGAAGYAALHLITCGGAFDYSTGHYLSSTVVFASLPSSRRAHRAAVGTYFDCVPGFERLLAQAGGDLPRFYDAVRALTHVPQAQRHRQLCAVSAQGNQ